MKKHKYLILAGILVIITILIIITGDKSIPLNNDNMDKLYSYLGEVDIYHCGGLNAYSGKKVTKDTISNSNRLCMAYYNIADTLLTEETAESTDKSANDLPICRVGEGITLSADDNKECAYKTFTKTSIDEAYKEIYGEKPQKYDDFNISNTDICYLEGDTYYCGTSETYNVTIIPETNIYRLKKSAVKRFNGDIIISDYFIRIANDTCYLSSTGDTEDAECTEALSKYDNFEALKDSEKIAFVKRYGKVYKHTFKEDKNSNYYWYKSY